MKPTLLLSALLAASSQAFQIRTPARHTTFLFSTKEDCKQGDMSVDCLLSEAEKDWLSGEAGRVFEHKGDAQLPLELATHKARVQFLTDALEKECVDTAKAALECEVDDARIECALSEIEQKWLTGDTGDEGRLSMTEELAMQKTEVERLEKMLKQSIASGKWEGLNTVAP